MEQSGSEQANRVEIHEAGASTSLSSDDLFSLSDVVLFFRRHRLLSAVATIASALLVVAWATLVDPPVYEATATLAVIPSTLQSDIQPPALPIQAYQQVLESDAVLHEAAERLRAQGVLGDGQTLRLGVEVRSRIFVSRRSEETTLAPMLEATAQGASAEQAAALANTWANVFVQRADALQHDNLLPTLELIDTSYRAERDRLHELAGERDRIVAEYQERIDQVVAEFDRELATVSAETEDAVAAFHIETRRLMEGALDSSPGLAEGSSALAASGPPAALARIISFRTQLAQTPRLLTLRKSIPDETLWQVALGQNEPTEMRTALEQGLISEADNPVHNELSLQLAQAVGELDTLSSVGAKELRELLARLEAVQVQRSAGLSRLVADGTLSRIDLERDQARRTRALEREMGTALRLIDLDISHQTALFTRLAEGRNEAGLAGARTGIIEVRVAVPAVPPADAAPRRLLLKGLLGALIGGLIAVVAGVVRDVERT